MLVVVVFGRMGGVEAVVVDVDVEVGEEALGRRSARATLRRWEWVGVR